MMEEKPTPTPANIEPAPVAEPPKDAPRELADTFELKPEQAAGKDETFSKAPTYVLLALTVIAVALVTIAFFMSH